MSDTQIDVTVVMAVHDQIDPALAALEALSRCSGVEFEIVVVCDRSPSGLFEQLVDATNQSARLTVLRSCGHGLTDALVTGCEKARGKYIARHDAGGRSHPSRLKKQMAALEQNQKLAFVGCWTEFCDPDFEPLFTRKGSSTPIAYRSLLGVAGSSYGPTSHGSVMFTRQAYLDVGGYRSEFLHAQDWDLWTRLAQVGDYTEVDECLYTHRIFPTGTSMSKRNLQQGFASLALEAARQRLAGEPDIEWVQQAQELRADAMQDPVKQTQDSDQSAGLYFLGACLAKSNGPKARQYFSRILRRNPFSPRVLLRYLATWWPAL